jgi:hypothetical protein
MHHDYDTVLRHRVLECWGQLDLPPAMFLRKALGPLRGQDWMVNKDFESDGKHETTLESRRPGERTKSGDRLQVSRSLLYLSITGTNDGKTQDRGMV